EGQWHSGAEPHTGKYAELVNRAAVGPLGLNDLPAAVLLDQHREHAERLGHVGRGAGPGRVIDVERGPADPRRIFLRRIPRVAGHDPRSVVEPDLGLELAEDPLDRSAAVRALAAAAVVERVGALAVGLGERGAARERGAYGPVKL